MPLDNRIVFADKYIFLNSSTLVQKNNEKHTPLGWNVRQGKLSSQDAHDQCSLLLKDHSKLNVDIVALPETTAKDIITKKTISV